MPLNMPPEFILSSQKTFFYPYCQEKSPSGFGKKL